MITRAMIPLAAALVAIPVQADAAPAGEWTAWYGCWSAVDSVDAEAPLVCVLPGPDANAVRIATIADGQITEETVVRADGVARPIEEGGCTGTESAFFSADGRRVFTRAELACSGLGRLSTGVLGMVSESEWVDAQALTVNGQHAVRTIRYRAAAAEEVPEWLAAELPQGQQLAQQAARLDASTPLDIAAVVEASGHVAAPAIEELLAERQHGFELNAATLVQLEEQGVPTSTIDVMVGLSYPAKFAVAPQRERRSDPGAAGMAEQNAARTWVEDCYDPYWSARRSGCYYGRYGYGTTRRGMYGYSPYGYDPYGWNYGTSRPIVVILRPEGSDEPRGGSVVKGRGYTRSGTARGTASPRSRETGGSQTTVRGSGSSTSSRAAPSPSSGGSSKPRTAKPRGGGGNDH